MTHIDGGGVRSGADASLRMYRQFTSARAHGVRAIPRPARRRRFRPPGGAPALHELTRAGVGARPGRGLSGAPSRPPLTAAVFWLDSSVRAG